MKRRACRRGDTRTRRRLYRRACLAGNRFRMSLTLHFHPLSSFCQKVLVALYENDTPFTPNIVDLGDPAQRMRCSHCGRSGNSRCWSTTRAARRSPESTIIIEYLALHYPGAMPLIPADADLRERRALLDRFFDLYVNMPMQTIVGNRRRPAEAKDPHGVDEARRRLRTAYGMIETDMAAQTLGDGRCVHDGRLRGRARALLREPRRAIRRRSSERRALFRAADGAAIIRARRERGRSVSAYVSEGMSSQL